MPRTTRAENKDSALGFSFPAIGREKVTAAFDGGRLTSDGGVLLLGKVERAMGSGAGLQGASPFRESLCALRCLRSPAAMSMPMIAMPCEMIRAFAWRWAS